MSTPVKKTRQGKKNAIKRKSILDVLRLNEDLPQDNEVNDLRMIGMELPTVNKKKKKGGKMDLDYKV